jgi:hypothetical protein
VHDPAESARFAGSLGGLLGGQPFGRRVTHFRAAALSSSTELPSAASAPALREIADLPTTPRPATPP